jgi:hypothetical protein
MGTEKAKLFFDLSIAAFYLSELALMISSGASDTKDTLPLLEVIILACAGSMPGLIISSKTVNRKIAKWFLIIGFRLLRFFILL